MNKNRPAVIAIAAVTADGKIARDEDDNIGWTSPEDKQFFAAETKKAGVIIMGRTTYEAIGEPLAGRLNMVMTTTPERFKERQKEGLLEFTDRDPRPLLASLMERGFDSVFVAGGRSIYTLFLNEGVVDELWLTIEPLLFGKGSIPLLHHLINEPQKLSLKDEGKLNEQTILLKYHVR